MIYVENYCSGRCGFLSVAGYVKCKIRYDELISSLLSVPPGFRQQMSFIWSVTLTALFNTLETWHPVSHEKVTILFPLRKMSLSECVRLKSKAAMQQSVFLFLLSASAMFVFFHLISHLWSLRYLLSHLNFVAMISVTFSLMCHFSHIFLTFYRTICFYLHYSTNMFL